jgi:hypothetical protein
MEEKYRALRIISGVYKFMGGFVIIVGSLFAVVTAISGSYTYNVYTGAIERGGINLIPALSLEVGVLLAGVGLLAFSQLLQLLIDLEENTRLSAESQSDQVKLLKMLVRQSQGVQRLPVKKEIVDFPEF